jgi:hypothetical protein
MDKAGELMMSGGYIYLAASGCPTLKIPVDSADVTSVMFQQYRDRNQIGASDMKADCGSIFAHYGTLVAKVSYNGRVWSLQGTLLQEPPVVPQPITPSPRRRASKRGSRDHLLDT